MLITHYGHACVVIEDPPRSSGRILIDPGDLADDLSDVGPVDAVLFTHEHIDHIDLPKLKGLLKANPGLKLYGNEAARRVLPPGQAEQLTVLSSQSGDAQHTIAGLSVGVSTNAHASIYPGLLETANNCYLVGQRVWHPGDSFVLPDGQADVLLVPTGAPWLKLSEAINYLRAVAPAVAIPIHQGGLGPRHRSFHQDMLAKYAPRATKLIVPPSGSPVEV